MPASRAIAHVAARSSGPPLDPTLRITLHFHPDRGAILDSLRADGVYRSQFETGTSNGGLTAHPGGDRWRWESRLFGQAYDDEPPSARPVYGSLNRHRREIGGSPGFGSAHLRLTGETLARATFCYPDSVFDPVDLGVAASCSLIELADSEDRDFLADYIEAHIHGGVRLDRDVEALVLDPCYRGTPVETEARRLPVPIEWHGGFRTTVAEIERHPEFRGPDVVQAAATIAADGHLDARLVGQAAARGTLDVQTLKRIWQYIARFGAPRP